MTDLANMITSFFPHAEVRPFQETAFSAVEDGLSVGVEGSNGLGKTVAALSACLPKALEKDLKIVYLARTHHQHDRVIQELKNISRKQNASGVSVR
jgi:Rad3-related DNA helicase